MAKKFSKSNVAVYISLDGPTFEDNINRIYVDKTMYIEKMEDLADSTIMFLRPRKFGKTLFTSTLECYYDKNRVDKFEKLFEKWRGNIFC